MPRAAASKASAPASVRNSPNRGADVVGHVDLLVEQPLCLQAIHERH
jgi:hypothetical protein